MEDFGVGLLLDLDIFDGFGDIDKELDLEWEFLIIFRGCGVIF